MVLYEFAAISAVTREDCVTLATNGLSTIDGDNGLCAVSQQATSSTLAAGAVKAYDSSPVIEFTPRYLATPVRGCRAAVVVLTSRIGEVLAEFSDYSVTQVDTYSFVWGNLNFTQDNNGYTPVINGSQVVTFAIWA